LSGPQFIACQACSKPVNRFLEVCPYCGSDPGGHRSDAPAAEVEIGLEIGSQTGNGGRYRSLHSVALFIRLLLGIFMVASVVLILTGWSYRIALLDLDAGRSIVLDRFALTEDRFIAASRVFSVVNVTLAVVFIVWFWSAYSNLSVLGVRRKRGTGWAIGGWFLPIANYFIPYSIGAEIWKAGEEKPNLEPVISWWALFVIMSIVRQIAFLAGPDTADDAAQIASTVGIDLVGTVVGLAAAVAAIRFVGLATARQERLAAAVPPASGWAPPPA
jgi:hypothetical protein